MAESKSSETIAASLRADICLRPLNANGMLHEVALAQRFGVSRTPVRQALQRLAYERMIAVKSGVGSIIMPLEPSARESDIQTALAIIEAVAKCATQSAAASHQVMDFAGMAGMMEMDTIRSSDDFFEVRSRFLSALANLIANPILEDAFRASYWRLIRWAMADFEAHSDKQIDHLGAMVKMTMHRLSAETIADAFAAVAEIESDLWQID